LNVRYISGVVKPGHLCLDITVSVCYLEDMHRSLNPTRRLHLVDVENLLGRARPTAEEARVCRDEYAERVAVQPDDLLVVACNHGAAFAVGLGWSGARLLLRSGQDGADLALLGVIARESVEDRFAAVVVASGDGRFADAVALLGRRGLDVTVVSKTRGLSRRLELAAKHVVLWDVPPSPAYPAAVMREAA
jgi:NYN domain